MELQNDFIFGVNPVMEKLRAAPEQILEILLQERPLRSSLADIAESAKRLNVRITYAPPKALNRLTGGARHQGVVAKVAPYRYAQFSDWFQKDSAASSDTVLLLDGITDPHNFGALLRTAEAVGVRRIILPQDRSVDVTPTVVKASAGAVHHLEICRIANLRRAMITLKENGYWLVGLDAQATEHIYDRSYPAKLGVVLGSEGKGIRPLVLRECDYRVSIPMVGRISSLNVAVAGAVFLYEILRQRRSIDKKAPAR
jgi:23S rRNA (guanosine2251-2'-O)-methyltransferase